MLLPLLPAVCRDVTITPRQRIQTYREITRLRGLPSRSKEQQDRLAKMEDVWQYDGDSTCAADGMCAVGGGCLKWHPAVPLQSLMLMLAGSACSCYSEVAGS